MEIIIILGILIALLFNFANGLNDAANSIATIIATKALTPLQAVGLAAVFNLLGPLLFTTAIAKTIGRGIVDPALLTPHIIFAGMIGSVLWILVTSYFGIPVSSSHALIGGLLGSGIAAAGIGGILWPDIVVVELLAIYCLFGAALGALALAAIASFKGENWANYLWLGALVGFTLTVPLLIATGTLPISGLLAVVVFIVVSPMLGLISAFAFGIIVVRTVARFPPRRLNGIFRHLQIFSGSLQSIGHGSNDAQNAMGMITAFLLAGGLISEFVVPLWVIIASAGAISLGTLLGGWRVIDRMANKITKIRPYQGFCASTAAGSVLSLMTAFGVPVSTTHATSGAIMGIGATRGYSAVKWGIVREIVAAWIMTIPASAIVAGIVYIGYRAIFL